MYKFLAMAFFAVLVSGCSTLDSLTGKVDVPEIPGIVKPPKAIDNELVGTVGWRLNIRVDKKGNPHIAADEVGTSKTYLYDRVNGKWRKYVYDSDGITKQAYNPCIGIADNLEFVTVVKWWKDGMGLMVRDNITHKPSKVLSYCATTGGMLGGLPVGLCGTEPGARHSVVVYAGNGGYWARYKWDGTKLQQTASGRVPCGHGGEKNGFDIARTGVWHVCSDWSYNNNKRSGAPLNWLDINTYDAWTGFDYCYPAVVGDADSDQLAYIAIDLAQYGGPGMMLQIYRDGAFIAPLDHLINIDRAGTTGSKRYAPQLAASSVSGCYIAYQAGDSVRIKYIDRDGKISGMYSFVGSRPTIAVDKHDMLHIAYIHDGIRYKKVPGQFTKDNTLLGYYVK